MIRLTRFLEACALLLAVVVILIPLYLISLPFSAYFAWKRSYRRRRNCSTALP